MVYRATASLSLGSKLLRAEADAEDLRAAIDMLEEELKRSLQSFKEKAAARQKRESRRVFREMRYDPAARLKRKGRIRNEGN